jgi:predicted amidohydrolase YtcJ
VGYHESVAGALDRWALDALVDDVPVRVQHRSGILWTVNSVGAERLGLDAAREPGVERDTSGRPTGRLFRLDAWLARRLPGDDPMDEVERVSLALAARGVTGVTDATPGATAEGLAAVVDAVAAGRLCQRVHAMAPAGIEPPIHQLVSRGPHKVLLDDDRLPGLDQLVELVRVAHGAGVPVAVHCVTAAQLALSVAGFEETGVLEGDRVEHASVAHPDLVARIAALGLVVVTNPGLVHSRGDSYLEEVDARDVPHLYPCAAWVRAGIAVAAGSDAPFGPVDPWTVVRAAHTRRTAEGRVLGGGEAVSLATAVRLLCGRLDAPGRARRIEPGEPGDLCLLAEGGLPAPGDADAVAATVVAGRVVYRAG